MKNISRILFCIIIANYLAQIVYAQHVYHNVIGKNLSGLLLLGATFFLFIIPYFLLQKGIRGGYVGMIFFLSAEFLFYFMNLIFSMIHGYPPFFQLANPDRILFMVFLIGYINLFASAYYLYYLLKNRKKWKALMKLGNESLV